MTLNFDKKQRAVCTLLFIDASSKSSEDSLQINVFCLDLSRCLCIIAGSHWAKNFHSLATYKHIFFVPEPVQDHLSEMICPA